MKFKEYFTLNYNMPFFHFPSEFVYWENVENHKEIKKELFPLILEKDSKTENKPFDTCKFNSSFHKTDFNLYANENHFLMNDKFINIIMIYLEKMINMYNGTTDNLIKIKKCDLAITSGWWNRYDTGDHQEIHTHKGPPFIMSGKNFYPIFSIIYILHDENEKSSIVFKKDGPLPLIAPHDDVIFLTSNVKDMKEGTILIFPYNLQHMVKPCIKPGRITISYNVYSSFQDK